MAAVAVALHALAAPAAPTQFELVTYNVAGLPEGISRSRPLANLPLIGELLSRYDIAVVQEDFAYPLELRRRLRHPHGSAPFVRGQRLDFGDGLSHFARQPFGIFRREAWASCNGIIDAFFDCLTPKGFTVARQFLAPGVSVDIYNLHMDAGWTPDDALARERQIEQLVSAIQRGSRGEAVIVAGDTNIPRREQRLLRHLMAEASLDDACEATRCPEPWRIDRVLYRGSRELRLRPTRWRLGQEFVDERGRPLSDHPAVVVAFEWERAAQERAEAEGQQRSRAPSQPPRRAAASPE